MKDTPRIVYEEPTSYKITPSPKRDKTAMDRIVDASQERPSRSDLQDTIPTSRRASANAPTLLPTEKPDHKLTATEKMQIARGF